MAIAGISVFQVINPAIWLVARRTRSSLLILTNAGMVMAPSRRKTIMGNKDKPTLSKITATEPPTTTAGPEKAVILSKAAEPAKVNISTVKVSEPVNLEEGSKVTLEATGTASTAFESSTATAMPESDLKTNPAPQTTDTIFHTSANVQTKMEIATEIYKRMKKTKSVTRKEIIEQFVAEAKLSKAGASTYYQLIKAKVK